MLYPFRKNRPREWPLALVSPLLLLVSLSVLVPCSATTPVGSQTEQEVSPEKEFDAVDTRYQELLDQFLQLYVKKYPPLPSPDIEALAAHVEATSPIEALASIRANLDVIRQNPTKREFDFLLQFLYQANDTATVKVLTDELKKAGDPVAVSQNYFLLARYYEARQNWQGVKAALSKVNSRDLSIGDHHYYQLLTGYALQNDKEHRKAIKFYQQIPATSPYFGHAKLNEGTANLRQGWWTEAHIEFEKGIEFLAKNTSDEEFRNRLLVVLGYSQLHYEFYRDARNTLRKVALNSASANKALMGIGLAAAYQKDFIGASNAFKLLTEKAITDLSVDESFLLLPFAYEETGDKAAAGLAYQRAINHFQKKEAELLSLQSSLMQSDQERTLTNIVTLEVRAGEIFAEATKLPAYLLDNYRNLVLMAPQAAQLGLGKEVSNMQSRYQKTARTITVNNIAARRAMLNSYLSQAKFGMAKLYDAP